MRVFLRYCAATMMLWAALWAGISPTHAELGKAIEFIRVEGTQRVERETVLTYLIVQEGMTDEAALVDRSVKTLFSSGLFSDVSIRREGAGLIVSVVENPIINRVAFEGNKRINQDKLGDESTLRPRQIYTRAKVQNDVERFIELYRRSGRFATRIDPKIIQLPQNRIDLIYEVDEGPVTGIRTIKFIGNRAFSDGELREEIVTRESRWWRFLSANDNYDPDRIAYDGESLRRFYLSQGYADFRVVNTNSELTRNGKEFFLTFTIEEGDIYTFGKSAVTSQLQSVDVATLQSSIAHAEGQTYDARTIDKTIDNLVQVTGELGFAFADVRPRVSRNREERIIDIEYVIEEGARVYVERININGNDRTRDSVLRRELRLAEGDAFNRLLLDRSSRAIRGLDFFSAVEITESPGSSDDQTIIDVNVAEKSTGSLNLGLGFSSSDNFSLQVGLTERNFLGKGQRFNLNVSGSRISHSFSVGFTEPYFLQRDLAASITIFDTSTRLRDSSGIRRDTLGVGVGLGFPVSDDGRVQLHTNIEQVENNNGVGTLSIPPYEGLKHTIGYSYAIDKRNDFIDPTEGWNLSFSQDVATPAGEIKFFRSTAITNYYNEIAEGWVFHGRISGGHVRGYDGNYVQYNDRFFRGGNSFRGFDTAGVGPRLLNTGVTDYTLGANKYLTATTEITLPIGIPKELGLKLNGFIDFGFVGETDSREIARAEEAQLAQIVTAQQAQEEANIQRDYAAGMPRQILDRDAMGNIRQELDTNDMGVTRQIPVLDAMGMQILDANGDVRMTDAMRNAMRDATLVEALDSNILVGVGRRTALRNRLDTEIATIRDDVAFRATYGLSFAWRSPFGPVQFDLARVITKEDHDRDRFFRFSVGTQF